MVQQQSVNTGDKPAIIIEECTGDLRLMGWERQEVLAKAEDDLSLQQDGDTVRVRCQGDAFLRVPEGASLDVRQVQGDTRIKSVKGAVSFGSASGDLSLRYTGPVQLEHASGDTSIKHVTGAITVSDVGGDLSVHDAQATSITNCAGDLSIRALQGALAVTNAGGDVSVEAVQGNVAVQNTSSDVSLVAVQGNVNIGSIGGDVNLQGVQGVAKVDQVNGDLSAQGILGINASVAGDAQIAFAPGFGASSVTCRGDISCGFTPDANATVHITSESSEININTPGPQGSTNVEQREHELKLGNGEVPVTLTATGDVSINAFVPMGEHAEHAGRRHGFNFDFDFDFDKHFAEAGAQWGAFGERMARQAQEVAERTSAQVKERVERATRRAEDKMRRAEEHARRAERHAQGAGHRMHWEGGWRVDRASAPPPPPGEPVSGEERLVIMRMLAQKKITAEQADQLLAALAGKQG